MALHYRTVIEPISKEDGGGFEAHIPTLGRATSVAVGDMEEEALPALKETKESLFTLWLQKMSPFRSLPMRTPSKRNVTGKFSFSPPRKCTGFFRQQPEIRA
jgi:hypothetical protein